MPVHCVIGKNSRSKAPYPVLWCRLCQRGKAKEKVVALKIQQDYSKFFLRKKNKNNCMVSPNFSQQENCKHHSEICPDLQRNEGLFSIASKFGSNNSVDFNSEI